MRTWALPLLALSLMAPVAAQQNTNPFSTSSLDHLRIPVEVTKTIKAEKAHVGDEVHLRMAEPILAGNGLVIPENAKLTGRVIRANPAEDGKHSHLAIIVDRAQWKDHVLALHAFVTGFGVRTRVAKNNSLDCITQKPNTSFRSRKSPLPMSADSDSEFNNCADNANDQIQAINRANNELVSEIKMLRNDVEGYTVLLSKKNVHLPSGLLLMLENQEQTALTARK